MIKRLCIFCGSSNGADPAFVEAGRKLGALCAATGIGVVYGGGGIGVMGAVADAALSAGGEVLGVIPKHLWELEVGHPECTRLFIVDSMHERKATMAELSDAFLALPGGIGTMEELFEVWTWGQLRLHSKPVGLLNVAGYFDPLIAFLDRMVEQKFLRAEHRAMLTVDTDADVLLARLQAYEAPEVERWFDRART